MNRNIKGSLLAFLATLALLAFLLASRDSSFSKVIVGDKVYLIKLEAYEPPLRLHHHRPVAGQKVQDSPWLKAHHFSQPDRTKSYDQWKAFQTKEAFEMSQVDQERYTQYVSSPVTTTTSAFSFKWVSHVVTLRSVQETFTFIVYSFATDETGKSKAPGNVLSVLQEEDGILKNSYLSPGHDLYRFPLSNLEQMREIIENGRAVLVEDKYQPGK
jgi:hypothetical protein